jgi:adenylate cyclase
MNETYQQQTGNEELWHTIFAEGHPELNKQHWLHKKLPHNPRCKLCRVPFAGIGGWIMRRRGKGVSSRNPNFCNACDGFIEAYPGGAEDDMSILFVDIRNSTQYADGAAPADVSRRVNAFLDAATEMITDEDGFIMAFYGDCVVAAWPPGFSGKDHAEKALKAAREMSDNTNIVDENGEAIPVGIGVHTGKVYIGTVEAAKGLFRDVSIFGQNVNLTARLASTAKASEALVSEATMQAAGNTATDMENRTLELKGLSEPVTAFVIS